MPSTGLRALIPFETISQLLWWQMDTQVSRDKVTWYDFTRAKVGSDSSLESDEKR
jgi:hypothetical protein